MDLQAIQEFMAAQRLGVVSSLGPDGRPQAALVGIAVTPGLEIVFDTVDTSRKYANLTARPACAIVVGWSTEQTVQLEGEAELLRGAELERYSRLYFDTWPDGRARFGWPGIAYFVVRPRWIRYSDYDRVPPLIDEFTPVLRPLSP